MKPMCEKEKKDIVNNYLLPRIVSAPCYLMVWQSNVAYYLHV